MNFFYCSDRKVLKKISPEVIKKIFGDYNILSRFPESYFVYSKRASNRSLVESNDYLAYIQGYVRNSELKEYSDIKDHNDSYVHYIINSDKPIQLKFNGLFTTFAIDLIKRNIILSTDWLAYYPVYYVFYKGSWIVSSSQISIAAFIDAEIDNIGLSQRLAYNKPYNIGHRTLLKHVKRISCSEKIILHPDGTERIYRENGLYRITNTNLKDIAVRLWEVIEQQFKSALKFENQVYVGLSGGIDSRITYAAIPQSVNIKALTYGENKFYEARIAKRVAAIKKSDHNSYPVYDTMFPASDMLKKYLYLVEPFMHTVWFSILSQFEDQDDFFILGDMCEAVTGRKIKSKFSREAQMKNFISTFIYGKKVSFEINSIKKQNEWETNKRAEIKEVLSNFKSSSGFGLTKSELLDATIADIEDEFIFIREQDIPYLELLDECYNWMHHIDGYQGLLLRSKFYATHLMSSNNILHETSCIHPTYRLNYRLVDTLFKTIPVLKEYSKIPLVHTPFIKMSAPNIIKLIMWGLRSKIDNRLIKRILINKNPDMRYRAMPSLNWVRVYQNDNLLKNINEWFTDDFTGMKDKVKSLALKRKNLEIWPLANEDIINLGVHEQLMSIFSEFGIIIHK